MIPSVVTVLLLFLACQTNIQEATAQQQRPYNMGRAITEVFGNIWIDHFCGKCKVLFISICCRGFKKCCRGDSSSRPEISGSDNQPGSNPRPADATIGSPAANVAATTSPPAATAKPPAASTTPSAAVVTPTATTPKPPSAVPQTLLPPNIPVQQQPLDMGGLQPHLPGFNPASGLGNGFPQNGLGGQLETQPNFQG